ncbi:MAG: cytochrome P450 [Acidobacteriaceae bacterium]
MKERALKAGSSSDRVDSPLSTAIAAAYYDEGLRAWVLTRYADVLAAFRAPGLVPTDRESKITSDIPDDDRRLKMRAETLEALSPRQLREWSKQLTPMVHDRVRSLPTSRPAELVAEFARPLCLRLAIMVTGVRPDEAEDLRRLAQPVSDAAAEPGDPVMCTRAAEVNVLLREHFRTGPELLRDSGFVALSHTIPCLLANSWFSLLQHPELWRRLHLQPDLVPQTVEELLRHAGLVRTLFRRATEDVNLNGLRIRRGDRLMLHIRAANRDPARFAQPNRIDLTCPQTGQLSLGAGPHSCVGASLIRMAMTTITRPLMERFASAHLAGIIEWKGGSGFRSPASLPVLLREGAT